MSIDYIGTQFLLFPFCILFQMQNTKLHLGSSLTLSFIISLISTRAVIGQFSGPYFPVRTAKTLPNCCVIYCQIFSTYIANKSLKLSFPLNCVLKRANDLKKNDFKLIHFAFDLLQKFEAIPHEWKLFLNPSETQKSRDI